MAGASGVVTGCSEGLGAAAIIALKSACVITATCAISTGSEGFVGNRLVPTTAQTISPI